MYGYPYQYQYPQQDSRAWFAAPFVGGLLGGVIGGALVRPRPFLVLSHMALFRLVQLRLLRDHMDRILITKNPSTG
ncbi:hypothetical protein AAHH67_08640 [Niallia circulans]